RELSGSRYQPPAGCRFSAGRATQSWAVMGAVTAVAAAVPVPRPPKARTPRMSRRRRREGAEVDRPHVLTRAGNHGVGDGARIDLCRQCLARRAPGGALVRWLIG